MSSYYETTYQFLGACVKLERLLGRDLFWLACRHHMLELILAKAFFVCFGRSKSPETELFKRFRDNWPKIAKTNVKSLTVTKKFKQQKESVTSFLQTSTGWSRNDYKELIDLTLLVLGNRPERFTWKKPGPIHHARWMAKLIYATKMYLLRGQGSAFELTPEEVKQLHRFVRFGALLYVKPWIEAPLAAEAAFNDLDLWRKIQAYRSTDSELASETSAVLERHLWYMSDELVGLGFFSKQVCSECILKCLQTF